MTVASDNLSLQGPDFLSFESGIPKTVVTDERSTIQTSQHRFLIGHQSLQWNWQEGTTLQFEQPVEVKEGTVGINAGSTGDFPAHSMFAFWIYNEKSLDRPLKVEFGSGSNLDCYFEMQLDFIGWRTAWVRFIDMEGTPKPNMDWFRFTPPLGVGSGRFYLDAIAPSTLVDAREPVSDYQIQARSPLERINWQGPKAGGGYPPATEQEIQALTGLEKEVHQTYLKRQTVTDQTLSALRERFDLKIFVDTAAVIRLIRRLQRDVAERGRSMGIVLIGAQQTASEVERRVVAQVDLLVFEAAP